MQERITSIANTVLSCCISVWESRCGSCEASGQQMTYHWPPRSNKQER